MAEPRICDDCKENEAEFELKKVTTAPGKEGFHRFVCRSCLGNELANDTTSIVRISKSTESAG